VHANVRRGLAEAYPLPPLPESAAVVVHDVLADEANGYRPGSRVDLDWQAVRAVGLWIKLEGDHLVVDLLPGWAAYPVRRGPARLFTLARGQIGRHRANFRFTGCACAPQWYYEQWTTQIAHTPAGVDPLTGGQFDRDVDDRVHLYGGSPRRSAKVGARVDGPD
jgi:hypothetical protein